MNLAQLKALVAVADQGSFTGAAAALGLTQSAVSHTVASLEKELAVPLVLRRRGGTLLTSHGQQVLRHAREAVHRVDRIAQDCTVVAGRHRGRLRVAAFPSAAQLLPRLIAELARCQPEVTVVLLEGTDAEVREWLRDRVIDLGVVAELRTGDQPSSPAPGALLAQDQMVAVLDRGHPLAGQPAVALDDLVDDAFLLSDGGCEPLLHQMHQAAGLRLQPARRVRDMATLLALVAEQLGVTVVPELALPPGHQLAVVPVTPTTHRALYLVPADEQDLPAAGHVLLDITRDRSLRRRPLKAHWLPTQGGPAAAGRDRRSGQ